MDLDKFKFSDGDAKRKELVEMARTAESAERYEDMCVLCKSLVQHVDKKEDLSTEERNLLSVAYKNVVSTLRASLRTLSVDDYKDNTLIQTYKQQVEKELKTVCLDVLKLLEDFLTPSAKETDSKVFYLKMAGDYYRYLAEFETEEESYKTKSLDNYSKATEAAKELSVTDPIRLGLALNYSVCHYEIAKDSKTACDLAKAAFDDAISKLDQLDESSYKDSTLIMQLLRDNLTLWTSEAGNDDEDDAE